MTPSQTKGHSILTWVVFVVSSLVVLYVAAIVLDMVVDVLPRPWIGREHRRRQQCLSNQRQILAAIAMYADTYSGRYPMDSTNPTLVGSMQLLSNLLPSAKVLYCPGDQRAGARPQADFKKLTTLNISYSYVPNLKWDSSPDSPVIMDRIYATSVGSKWPPDGNHKDAGGNTSYRDGHVEWTNHLPVALKDKDGREVALSP